MTMSGFLKIRDFFKKSVLRKTADFSVSDRGDPLILTCLAILLPSTESFKKGYCQLQAKVSAQSTS